MTTCSDCDVGVEVYQKRDRTIRVTITGPGDLTNAKVWFSVKQDKDDEDVDAKIIKKSLNAGGADDQAKITDGPNGVLEIYIKPADTEAVDPGDYYFDVVIETAAGRKLQGVLPSRFTIKRPITET